MQFLSRCSHNMAACVHKKHCYNILWISNLKQQFEFVHTCTCTLNRGTEALFTIIMTNTNVEHTESYY